MRVKTLLLTAISALIFGSCTMISTLHPLSENESDFLFRKELIGKWGKMNDSSGFYYVDTAANTKGKQYKVEIFSREKDNESTFDTLRFLVRLINISNSYFLDCQFDLENTFPNYSDWLIAKHFFCSISFPEPDKIEISYPDADELMKLIDQKKILLNYIRLKKDDYLILNKPQQLRKELAEFKKYSLLNKEKDILVRLK